MNEINSFHPTIKFTVDWSKEKINFLDLEVILNNGVLSTDLLVKATDTHQFLDPTFCHPYHCKKYCCLIVLYFLFHGLHFATTLKVLKPVLYFHMASFNYGAKEVRDVDRVCACHQSNIMPDSIFSVNIARCVICLFVFCFVLFYVRIKG